MQPHQPPDRSVLAGRIQGFGNVNPPPLEEEKGADVAKRAVGRLGGMVGEELMGTVEDIREKGVVCTVKDSVVDAGDILIDGVTGILGWVRGVPPAEEDNENSEHATKALSNGPSGAAYGITQASPTGGINAVWIMPEDADPTAIAQLAQQGGLGGQLNDPRVPKNIQPYQPSGPPRQQQAAPMPGAPMQIPGGPTIAPYQPAPAGPAGFRGGIMPFVPGGAPAAPGFVPGMPPQQPRWGPGGYAAAPPASTSASSGGSGSTSGAKGLVERIAKGEVIVGADVAKRLVSQCQATKTTHKQLGEIVSERVRRLYLGLDGGDPADADAALARLLALADALIQQESDLARNTVKELKTSVNEELMSLRSSAKYKDQAEPMLRRLGLVGGGGGAAAEGVADLLGAGGPSARVAAPSVPAKGALEADLLGGAGSNPGLDASADFFGGSSSNTPMPADSGLSLWDPLAFAAPSAPTSAGSNLLAGLSFDASVPAAAPVLPATAPSGGLATWQMGGPSQPMSSGVAAPMGGGNFALATLARTEAKKQDTDVFGFVGEELSKAGSSKP